MADETMTLEERVLAFMMMKLPGQLPMMHMGTSYLVNDLCAEIKRLESAIAERKVPHGWQLVPIVPTLAMLVAGRQTLKGSSDEADGLRAKAVYTRMLAAAPKVAP